jgi:uncharacterized membrane protein
MNRDEEAAGRSPRGTLEFERLAFFTDAVFAIAMTLLIVAVAVPRLRDENNAHDLWNALGDKVPEFVAFFIGFAVLGRYWLAQHTFYGYLDRIDQTFATATLVYLAFVAWLPFPTALLGELTGNPISVSLFALSAGAVSALEAVLLAQAQRHMLLRRVLPSAVFRHAMRTSLLPEVFFVLSVPVSFLNTYVAIAMWFLAVPGEVALDRIKPAEFDDYFR